MVQALIYTGVGQDEELWIEDVSQSSWPGTHVIGRAAHLEAHVVAVALAEDEGEPECHVERDKRRRKARHCDG